MLSLLPWLSNDLGVNDNQEKDENNSIEMFTFMFSCITLAGDYIDQL